MKKDDSVFNRLSPYLIQQFHTLISYCVLGHHLAVGTFDPLSVEQAHLYHFAQAMFHTVRRYLYALADVVAVQFSYFAMFASTRTDAATGVLDDC
jgi:hypothetical protein